MTAPRPSRGPGRRPTAARGFTLMELLVALVLIGLVTSFAVLSLQSESPGARQRQEARRLLARMDLARDEALMQARSIGIRLEEDGYYFVEKVDGQWQRLEGPGFGHHRLPAEMRLEVDVEGREISLGDDGFISLGSEDENGGDAGGEDPQIYFLAGGEIIPSFNIRLISGATMTEYLVHPGAERWLALTREDL